MILSKILVILTLLLCFQAKAEYLFVEGKFHGNKKWLKVASTEEMNLKILLQKLARSKTGRDIIRRANKKAGTYGETLYDIIKKGHGSLTDTTLIRKFSAGNPEHIVYESKSKVYINKELNQYDALLDLAHELTHFVYRRDFNPYKLNFSLSDFIKDTVEGHGGEVAAFLIECQVQKELFGKSHGLKGNCKKIINEDTGELSRNKAISHFYQVGQYFDSFSKVLEKHGIREDFPRISESKTSFVSSAYGIPYPVAAFEEYMNVLGKVCANDKKRMAYFKNQKKGRFPASQISSIQKSYIKRCSAINDSQ